MPVVRLLPNELKHFATLLAFRGSSPMVHIRFVLFCGYQARVGARATGAFSSTSRPRKRGWRLAAAGGRLARTKVYNHFPHSSRRFSLVAVFLRNVSLLKCNAVPHARESKETFISGCISTGQYLSCTQRFDTLSQPPVTHSYLDNCSGSACTRQ